MRANRRFFEYPDRLTAILTALVLAATPALGSDDTAAPGERDANVLVGWRALGQDYSKGSAPSLFVYDVVSHGPVFALAVTF